MKENIKHQLINYLAEFITQNKRDKIDQVITNRTRHVTVVLEDIYQPHNASAVIRSYEALGAQNIHVIEKKNKFKMVENIALGAAKWIDIMRYQDITSCIKSLKDNGYRIIATTPHPPEKNAKLYTLDDLPVESKMALMFGTEETGLSKQAIDLADEFMYIPMYGFTESFNISVSVALAVHYIITKLQQSKINWQLDKQEQLDLKLEFYKRAIKAGPQLAQKFVHEHT